ncbi:MAG: amidohydrolase [Planctomycetaceae bacterium]
MTEQTPTTLVDLFQKTMSHAWMVRTFIKHCDEVDDYPELMGIVRAVFDMSRAIESKTDDPATYFRFARKKIGKLRKAAEQFQQDAWTASTHTNFQQAVTSVLFATEQMEDILAQAEALLKAPPLTD